MTTHTIIRIRELQPTDSVAFDKLVTSTLNDSFGEVLPEEELRTCAKSYRSRGAGQICYIAEADGVLVGYGVAQRKPLARPSTHGCIERLYVCHDYLDTDTVSGETVAAKLVETLCGASTATDSTATTDQSIALALYQRWGFVDVAAFGMCLSVPSGHGRFMTETLAA